MKNTEFVELLDPKHVYTQEALKLYEQSFPVEERESSQVILEGITERANNTRLENQIWHFFAFIQNKHIVGISMYNYHATTRLAFLHYLAIQPELRNGGFGSKLFQRTLIELDQDAKKVGGKSPLGMCWEVERPCDTQETNEKGVRNRRIAFYKRNNSFLLDDINYIAPPINSGLPSVPYYLMFASATSKDLAITVELKKAILDTTLLYGYHLGIESVYYKQALSSFSN